MKILISNDDGVDAPGLSALANALATIADITVVAPDRNRSASSNSLTVDLPLRVIKHPNGFYAVNGTPTDSVHLAITGLLDEHPDMIVAGINSEPNLGDDVLYSGTVAAAMEGRFLGYPAMAVSLVTNGKGVYHYDTAAAVASYLLKQICQLPSKKIVFNVNVPNRPLNEIKGFRFTRLGHRHVAEAVIQGMDPRGKPIYWVGPPGKEQDAGEGTDFFAINQGYVSITPLKADITDHRTLDELVSWEQELTL